VVGIRLPFITRSALISTVASAASPPSVRKGCAFPLATRLLRLCLRRRRSLIDKDTFRKGRAFPHGGRQAASATVLMRALRRLPVILSCRDFCNC
jgi:hypothetical protein